MTDIRHDPMASETGITAAPPFVFIAGILVAVLLGWIHPFGFGLPTALRLTLAGLLVLALPAIMIPVIAAFRRASSEYDVQVLPRAIVTDGPFRLSRNPGYIAMFLFALGICLLLDNAYAAILVAAGLVFVHYKVVRKEEAVLENAFGEDYLEYKRRVRRWL